MKVNYTTSNQRISAEISADTPRNIFAALAEFQEVFDEPCCSKCDCDNLRFVVRTVDDNDYYELRCLNPNCRAKLQFGCNKDGKSLFPKRKDGDNWRGSNGWTRWNKEKGCEE